MIWGEAERNRRMTLDEPTDYGWQGDAVTAGLALLMVVGLMMLFAGGI